MNEAELRELVPRELLRKELAELMTTHSVEVRGLENGVYGVIVKNVPVPEGYRLDGEAETGPKRVDVLLRLSEG